MNKMIRQIERLEYDKDYFNQRVEQILIRFKLLSDALERLETSPSSSGATDVYGTGEFAIIFKNKGGQQQFMVDGNQYGILKTDYKKSWDLNQNINVFGQTYQVRLVKIDDVKPTYFTFTNESNQTLRCYNLSPTSINTLYSSQPVVFFTARNSLNDFKSWSIDLPSTVGTSITTDLFGKTSKYRVSISLKYTVSNESYINDSYSEYTVSVDYSIYIPILLWGFWTDYSRYPFETKLFEDGTQISSGTDTYNIRIKHNSNIFKYNLLLTF